MRFGRREWLLVVEKAAPHAQLIRPDAGDHIRSTERAITPTRSEGEPGEAMSAPPNGCGHRFDHGSAEAYAAGSAAASSGAPLSRRLISSS